LVIRVGILALQGDAGLHEQALGQLGVETALVRRPEHLEGLTGLVVPGGESTAILALARSVKLLPAIKKFVQAGGMVFGTCAGAIMLAAEVTGPSQDSLGLIDITVERNGYGRQLDSREARGQMQPPLGDQALPLVFIRAPRITRVGAGVSVLATYRDEPVLVELGRVLAATFHPELTDDVLLYVLGRRRGQRQDWRTT